MDYVYVGYFTNNIMYVRQEGSIGKNMVSFNFRVLL